MGASVRASRPSIIFAAIVVAVLACGLAADATAAPTRVQPSNGKWGGIQPSVACNSAPAPDPSPSALPDGLTCPAADLAPNDEVVAFSLAGRRITSLKFDIEIQCLSTPDGITPPAWQGTVLSYRPTDFGYAGLDGGTAIPARGLLRIGLPIEESLDHPAGTVRATFDFRGARAKVSLYYSSQSTAADGTWVSCYSAANHPSVIHVTRLAR